MYETLSKHVSALMHYGQFRYTIKTQYLKKKKCHLQIQVFRNSIVVDMSAHLMKAI